MLKQCCIKKVALFAVLSISLTAGTVEAQAPALQLDRLNLSGEYETSGGEATYTLPISVSSGRAGYQPELSLDYRSDAPNSIMGMGWQVNGQSVIYRCGKNLATDGLWGGVNFNANDRFCLDGQRLIAIKGSNGADSTEYRIEENGYDRIVSFGSTGGNGPAYFKIWKTDGSILEYGVTKDARVELSGQSLVYKWALNKKTDITKANHINYLYSEDNKVGTHRLSQIRYTGGKIEFLYEDRRDRAFWFLYGSRINRFKRLNAVVTYDADNKEVGRYQLSYQYSNYTHRSLLSKITYSNLPRGLSTPITFEWVQAKANESSASVPRNPDVSLPLAEVKYFDVDRDGNKESFGIVEASTSSKLGAFKDLNGQSTFPGQGGTLVGSLDKPIVKPAKVKRHCNRDGDGSHRCDYYYTLDSDYTLASYMPGNNGVLVEYNAKTHVAGDFNGDGKQTLRAIPSQETSFFGNHDNYISKRSYYPTSTTDIDNDGIDDYSYRKSRTNYLTLGLSSKLHKEFDIYSPSGWDNYRFVDLNLDGYLDFVSYNVDYSRRRVELRTQFFDGKVFKNAKTHYFALDNRRTNIEVNFIDYSNDGYLDVYIDGKIYTNQGEESVFSKNSLFDLPRGIYLVDDINGDGIDDFVTHEQNIPPYRSSKVYLSKGTAVDRIQVIKEHALTFNIDYKPASDKAVHTQERYYQYPVINTTPNKLLVSTVEKMPKGYQSMLYTYRYEGAKSHALGGGFLGFSRITEVLSHKAPWFAKYDFVTTTTVSEFNQIDREKAGKLKSVTVYKQSKENKLFNHQSTDKTSYTTYQYNVIRANGGNFQVYPRLTEEEIYEKGVLQRTNMYKYTLNEYGALIKKSSRFSNGLKVRDTFTINETYTYELDNINNVSNDDYWKIDALKQSSKLTLDWNTGVLLSNKLEYEYNNLGLLSSIKTYGSSYYNVGDHGKRFLLTSYQYDIWGNVVRETYSGSELPPRSTSYRYERNGLKLKESINSKGHVTAWKYDSQGRVLAKKIPLYNRNTTFEYDAFGRENRITLPGKNNVTRKQFFLANECIEALDSTSYCIKVEEADGSQSLTYYDYADREVRRLHRAFDGRWVVVDTEWDLNGRKRFVTAARFLKQAGKPARVVFDYDIYNREIRRSEPQNRGGSAVFITKYLGFRTEKTDARGFKQSTTHNVMGYVIRKDEPLGSYQTYDYFPDGKLRRTTDSDGNATLIKYDSLGYRMELDDPDIGLWNYRYNALGQLVYQRDSNGVVTTINYDSLGRKIKQKEGSETSLWGYDERGAVGTVSWMSGKGQRTDYFYNLSGLLQEKAVTVGSEIFSTQYVYDGFERIAREIRPDGLTLTKALGKLDNQRLAVEYLYNQYGYLAAVRSPRSFADDIFTSVKFREETRQLINEAIKQANIFLGRANRYAKQERFFRDKRAEYKQKTIGVYNLDRSSAQLLKAHPRYKQWCDKQGVCYLRPTKWTTVHSGVSTLVDVTLGHDVYRISSQKDKDTWKPIFSGLQGYNTKATRIHENALKGLKLTPSYNMKLSGDYDGNGTPDIMRESEANGVKADKALRSELLFAAEDLEQAADVAELQYKQYKALATGLIGLSEKVAQLSGLYCEFANKLAGRHIDNKLRQNCKSDDDISQADMLDTILTNAEISASSKNKAYLYYWQRQATDAFDHTLNEMLGNGLMNTYEYDAYTGRVNTISTYQGNQVYSSDTLSAISRNQHIRYLSYQYDKHNNVTERFDEQLGITDVWTYDALDRVESNTVVLVDKARHGVNNPDLTGKRTFRYDPLGNIRYKSDVGDYQYSGVGSGPHAVTSANGLDYRYDAAGNMISAKAKGNTSNKRTISWSPFNKPTRIVRDGKSVEFSYDANHERYLKRSSDGTETFYFGKTYEREKNQKTGEIQHKHFIFADGKLIALNTQTLDSKKQLKNKQVRYLHYDALDSVDMVSDGYGLIVEKRSYDTWGKQRHVLWQSKSITNVIQSTITNRGYTGHEEIAEVALIHMNGRIYDQELGRFLSADPFVQAPFQTFSFNRYTYVNNNPLKYTDPSGYYFQDKDGNGVTGTCNTDGSLSGMNSANGGDKNEHQDENRSGWVEVISINHGPRDGFNEVVSVYGYYEEPDFGSQSEFAKAWVVAALINKGASQDVIDSVARDLDANSQNIRDAYRTATMMAAVGAVLSRKSGTKGADDFVDLASPQRRRHILDGDATGGGHRPGTGKPGKSEFPQGWSDDKIMHEISDIATDPNAIRRNGRGGRTITEGTRNGIDIRVIQERNGDIVSGFPTNVPRNPR
ncbi:RHS repeat-associated core domain-containing protein [Vibrio harveyi]|uniref:RHS repeat-associated core domain-containing protein n=1 Tax=Vibrio harveyi TaxID=669 RepID=UPI003BB7E8B8